MKEKTRSINRGVAIAITIILSIGICLTAGRTQTYAAKWTIDAINAEIKTTEQKYAEAKKKYETAVAENEKKTEGTVGLLFADIISSDPLIVYGGGFGGYGSYYWITDPGNLSTFGKVTGVIKPTGEYATYNGITCAVAKAAGDLGTVKVDGLLNRMDELKAKITRLKLAKDYKPQLSSNAVLDEDEPCLLQLGMEYNLKKGAKIVGSYYNSNKLLISSSDKSIISVDSKGIAKTKKEGKAKITYKASITGNTLTKVVKVINAFIVEDSEGKLEHYNKVKNRISGVFRLTIGDTDTVSPKYSSSKSSPKVVFTSDEPSIVKISSDGKMEALEAGSAEITAASDDWSVTYRVKVKKPETVEQTTESGYSEYDNGYGSNNTESGYDNNYDYDYDDYYDYDDDYYE